MNNCDIEKELRETFRGVSDSEAYPVISVSYLDACGNEKRVTGIGYWLSNDFGYEMLSMGEFIGSTSVVFCGLGLPVDRITAFRRLR